MFNDEDHRNEVRKQLISIVGRRFVITEEKKMKPFTQGWRLGGGPAAAVVRPATLLEMWNVLKLCVEEDLAILVQATNTGLTGGSTPNGFDYDRPIVIINTLRLDNIQLIDDSKQFIAFAGATLFQLEDILYEKGREPHSVLGSSCIGASIVGGVCNNSGGALLQRGPAYTELALYAKINTEGVLELVNELEVDLGDSPEEILHTLQNKRYTKQQVRATDKLASDRTYKTTVREVDAETPSRFNHDSSRLYGASGCAGKIAVFAVRIDSYKRPENKRVFYVGVNDTQLLETMRREILRNFRQLPVSGEYVHRRVYDVTKKYGKDNFFIINTVGSKHIQKLFNLKTLLDRWAAKIDFLPTNFSDKLMQKISCLLPNQIPSSLEKYREKYEHHWILEMSDEGIDEARDYLISFFKNHDGGFIECSEKEGDRAMLLRFLAAGAISRYHICEEEKLGDMISIDVALRRNEWEWFKNSIDNDVSVVDKFCYGHFFCHVLHQNYILKKGVDARAVKKVILDELVARGAEYPAEHNVGHEYKARDALHQHYLDLDPTNTFNPGIGQTSKNKNWM
ncbi:MAG TPA: D-lactate dehydrogenase [Gammaproteobacteria bacterium]|nr:D-lactate dehydrogenase [Gammaproteobacteria bacterium]